MEKLVVTLETSRRLKAAGFPGEGTFWWLKEPHRPWAVGITKFGASNRVADPTAQEIADRLDWRLPLRSGGDSERSLHGGKAEGGWFFYYGQPWPLIASGDTMAEALAQLWLTLNESKETK
ncbi:hypothetical protein [Arthrobacter sp. NicSoilC5]|uniref:hypothetical protein n=1 Tax=Arthrobacter sp. NicSoilC5 TaxID=2831000 RepID=UPI001CC74A7D|nr:hypothetical protein [Arthrobacter sp. NicSoilC5]BCW78309.1 hypothetical protein NicSoilC5_03280 [Arthrobacter sp. NicSoilC5]